MAAVHAYEARRVFIDCIKHGEPEADIVKAALAISAEDDAIGVVAAPVMDECVVARPTPWWQERPNFKRRRWDSAPVYYVLVCWCKGMYFGFRMRFGTAVISGSSAQPGVQPKVEPAAALI